MKLSSIIFLVFLCVSAVGQTKLAPNVWSADSHFNMRFRYDGHSLSDTTDSVHHLIVVIHGFKRNATKYCSTARKLLDNNEIDSTAVFAPQFLTDADGDLINMKDLYFSNQWSSGSSSRNKIYNKGSFEITERMLKEYLKVLPSLQRITFLGHSAGGQFVQRFAIRSFIESDSAFSEIDFQYIVCNPSSYTYLNPLRYDRKIDTFCLPKLKRKTLYYDHWKYGLEGLEKQNKIWTRDSLTSNYLPKKVYYIIGSDDNDNRSKLLDKSGQAKLQGPNRLERARLFYTHHLNSYKMRFKHSLIEVPEVGHSHKKIFNSKEVVDLLK